MDEYDYIRQGSRLDFLVEIWVYVLVVVMAVLLICAVAGFLDMDDTEQRQPLTRIETTSPVLST